MMAAQYLGAIPVPRYQDAIAAEMVYVLQDAAIAVAVVEATEQVDKMLEAREECTTLKHDVYDDPGGLRNYLDEGLMSYESLLELGRDFLAANPEHVNQAKNGLSPDEPAAMFYTSGTTGKPKGVVLTHHALIDRAWSYRSWKGSPIAKTCSPTCRRHG